jgi:hypothetical protein
MPFPPNPEDRPDPMENMPAVRARIPDHVAKGEISTGVIVVTGATEYVLDFVRNLPRPNCIVARVVLPHLVMPQFIDALSTNVEMCRGRYGDLPGTPPAAMPPNGPQQPVGQPGTFGTNTGAVQSGQQPSGFPQQVDQTPPDPNAAEAYGSVPPASPAPQDHDQSLLGSESIEVHPGAPLPQPSQNNPNVMKRQNPQDVYDELKLRDEILSGSYANAVMIGHGPYEFSFDFITNFYPQSAVSCRVYMASGHVLRLLDSLKASWEQIRGRYGFPPKP